MVGKPIPCSVWGLQGVKLAGGMSVDSYDSTAGSYSAGSAGAEGNVCSCKNINMLGSPTVIDGEAFFGSGYSFSTSGQSTATAGSDSLPACPADPVTDMTYVSTHNDNATAGYASGAALSLGSHASVTLSAGTYYFSSITLGSNATLN